MTSANGLRRGEGLGEFYRFVVLETDDCVLWPYARNTTGYGLVRLPGAGDRGTHRFACEVRHGPPPFKGAYAIHSCRNKNCMNYRHLRWGTPKENQEDRVRDGTHNRGERQGGSKLTTQDVLSIRHEYAQGGILQRELGVKFGVSREVVNDILCGRSWGWLMDSNGRVTP